ncbi:hypothetical protein FN846DRAFT_903993 [Sphaerosporella brunnea]|uniref:Uncharacterized protein n=1 Tax=Sphaerosporella brunnea TaxID=1250544 RepID=A0A5J5F5M2_9PEZI|nr:hypothetical protein FN846DRAFT_903993 [Sphaerosporella brunnea]
MDGAEPNAESDSDEDYDSGADVGPPNKTAAEDDLVEEMTLIDLEELDSLLQMEQHLLSSETREKLLRTLCRKTRTQHWELLSFVLYGNDRHMLVPSFSLAPGAANQVYWAKVSDILEDQWASCCTGALHVARLNPKDKEAGTGDHDLEDLDSLLKIVVVSSGTNAVITNFTVDIPIFSAPRPGEQLLRMLCRETQTQHWELVSFGLLRNHQYILVRTFSLAPGAANQQHWATILNVLEVQCPSRCTGTLRVVGLMSKGKKAGTGGDP